MSVRKIFIAVVLISFYNLTYSQNSYILKPDRVFDGFTMHNNWVVQVSNDTIAYVGSLNKLKNFDKSNLKILKGTTLLPGMIEGHGHMFLYPYNQKSWNDQVLKESQSYRVVRATVHAKKTLNAGFTSFRDLGTEGAGYADYGLKKAINDGIIEGPKLEISSKAIVATGSYGPKGFAPEIKLPLGAEEADGENIIRVVRSQISAGADFIKVYADYRWGKNKEAMPTFSIDELKLIVKTASSSGRYVAAHAATAEGMRRAIAAGIKIIEHGDGGTPEIFRLMKEKNVALCPTLAAGYFMAIYKGWKPHRQPTPKRIKQKIKSFKAALKAGVTIVAGGDVGVFTHGNNVIELEKMQNYGMPLLDVLKSVTSTSAKVLEMPKVGVLKMGNYADLVVVKGNPLKNISVLREVKMVVKNGKIVLKK
jgi:imidazolonepropionase-like amidohydrolase